MPEVAVDGAVCNCTVGSAPCALTVSVTSRKITGKSVSNMNDTPAKCCLEGFGQCAILTAINQKPTPCAKTPPDFPWILTATKQKGKGGIPAILTVSLTFCPIGGVIFITDSGQTGISRTTDVANMQLSEAQMSTVYAAQQKIARAEGLYGDGNVEYSVWSLNSRQYQSIIEATKTIAGGAHYLEDLQNKLNVLNNYSLYDSVYDMMNNKELKNTLGEIGRAKTEMREAYLNMLAPFMMTEALGQGERAYDYNRDIRELMYRITAPENFAKAVDTDEVRALRNLLNQELYTLEHQAESRRKLEDAAETLFWEAIGWMAVGALSAAGMADDVARAGQYVDEAADLAYWRDVVKSAKSSNPSKSVSGLDDVVNVMDDVPVPKGAGNLSNLEARQWYLNQEAQIKNMIDTTKPLEQQASQAFNLRNQFRTQARELMSDRALAESLYKSDPNMTWTQIVEKYTNKGFSGDSLWQEIINASTRSRTSVNQGLGLQ